MAQEQNSKYSISWLDRTVIFMMLCGKAALLTTTATAQNNNQNNDQDMVQQGENTNSGAQLPTMTGPGQAEQAPIIPQAYEEAARMQRELLEQIPLQNELVPADNLAVPRGSSFLNAMDDWQRRIALLNLALQAGELEVQRAEQTRALTQLQADRMQMMSLANQGMLWNVPGMGNEDRLSANLPGQQQTNSSDVPEIMPIQVINIQGVGEELQAAVLVNREIYMTVKAGSNLPDGRVVTSVTGQGVQVEDTTYGISAFGNTIQENLSNTGGAGF